MLRGAAVSNIGAGEKMSDFSVIVCEKTGKWAAAIRRVLRPESGLCETRGWPACSRELKTRTAAFVALEVLPENAEAVCRRLAELTRRSRHVHAVLLADRSLKPVEWLLREAGGAHVLFSRREIIQLRPIWERFWAQIPPSQMTFREHVWSRLPWTKYASAEPAALRQKERSKT